MDSCPSRLPTLSQRSVNSQQLVEQSRQISQIKRVRAVGFGIGRVVVDFDEYPVHSGANGRPCQHRNEFRLATALARSSGVTRARGWKLHGVGGIENHGSES